MFTYSGDPGSSAKDEVRFIIGDTDPGEPLLQDGEITYVLSQVNNVPLRASIKCCVSIMTKFARMCDESVGQVRMSLSQRYKAYQTMLLELQKRLAIEGGAIPFAGGISKPDVQTRAQDPNRVKPEFTKHMMENQDIAPWVSPALQDVGNPAPLEE